MDEAIFIEPKGDKRILHFRSTKFPARSLIADLPNSMNVNEFNLQDHMDLLRNCGEIAEEFAL